MKRTAFLKHVTGLACLVSTTGFALTIDFESISDSGSVGNTYAGLGVTFSGATVATSGISLNESELPPRSGSNVAFDDGGPISGDFTTPVSFISAYLTYLTPVTLSVYDSNGDLLGSVTTAFSENVVSSGNAPNELLKIELATGIKSFSFAGSASGGSFALDDLSFSSVATSVPDSGMPLSLLVISILGLRLVSGRQTQA